MQRLAHIMLARISRLLSLAFLLHGTAVLADELHIAVTSNFAPLMEKLATEFEKTSGHKLSITSGASGRLFTQISNGAPFDLFLSADNERPAQLVRENKAIAGTVFPYAIGHLLLWSPTLALESQAESVLKAMQFNHLAMANPKLAPYGLAAQQVLQKLQVWESIQNKLVLGENITQALQFVETSNAELGFIAESQWLELSGAQRGKPWRVPDNMHEAIVQDAVIVHDSAAARSLALFLRSEKARAVISTGGYSLP